MFIKRWLFFFALFLSLCCSAATDSSWFYHMTIDNGLPSNNVYSVIQDRLGFIWMATDNGVVKYNGYSFRVFNTNDGLSSNDVWRVYEDRSGRIWCLSNTFKIGYIKGDVYHSIHLSDSSDFINPREITEIDNIVLIHYVERNEPHIAIIKGNSVKIIELRHINANKDVWTARMGADANVWFFLNKDGLIIINKWDPLHPWHRTSVSWGTNMNDFAFLIKDVNPLTYKSKFYSYEPNGNFLTSIDLAKGKISRIYLDKDHQEDRIVLAYMERGKIKLVTNNYFYTLDAITSVVEHKKAIPASLRSGLTWNMDYHVFFDWYCTSTTGVLLRNKYPILSESTREVPQLKTAKIITVSSSGIFWWDRKKSEVIVTKGSRIISRWVFKGMGELRTMCENGKSEWLMAFVKGIFRFDTNTKTLKDFFSSSNVLIDDSLMMTTSSVSKSFYFINSSRIERVSDSSCLMFGFSAVQKIDINNNNIETRPLIYEKLNGYLKDTFHNQTIIYDKKKVFLYDKNWKELKISNDQLRFVGINDILNILTDSRGRFLIHCEEGIFYFNPASGKISRVHTNLNLSSSRSFIWGDYFIVIGNFGLAYDQIKNDGGFTGFQLLGNVKNTAFNRVVSCAIDPSGDIYIKGEKRVARLSFDSLIHTATDLFSFDEDTLFHFSLKNPFQKKINSIDTVVIDQDAGAISLDVVNFFGSTGQLYRYRILGSKWQTSSSGDIFLKNISPGTYYKIQYYAQDAFWKSDLCVLYVYQPYKWYQTLLWRAIFWSSGFILFGLSLLIASIITKRLVARKTERKRWQTELELRAIHSQINPHFIFNTLATALFYISKQRSAEAYDHVSRFSKLLRGYLKSSRERLISLNDEMEMLDQYIRLQRARFKKPFYYQINIDPLLKADQTMIPSLLLQPLVENAINHGLFHKLEDGKLIISFTRGKDDMELICTIDDNGIGRKQAKVIQQNLKFDRKSYGSALTQDLVDVFKKFEQMDIVVEYSDKELPDTGTIVRLEIKNLKTMY